jgi:hypothetical protein
MKERKKSNPLQRLDQYQPSKTALLWACAGAAIVTVVVGFSWGGWVTGGTAQSMAEDSADQARQELASLVCVERFLAMPDAGDRLSALKQISSSYEQGKFVQDGGWAIMPVGGASRSSSDDRKAATACGQELAKREIPAAGTAAQATDGVTVAQ